PWRGRRASRDRRRVLGAEIDRVDPDAVIGLADQLFERRTLQHAVDQLAPVIPGCWRKIRSQAQIFGGGRHHSLTSVLFVAPEIATGGRPSQTLFWSFQAGSGRSGSRAIPSVESPASASRTLRPAMTRSGTISASGTSTKARSNMRGCGRVSSFLLSLMSS